MKSSLKWLVIAVLLGWPLLLCLLGCAASPPAPAEDDYRGRFARLVDSAEIADSGDAGSAGPIDEGADVGPETDPSDETGETPPERLPRALLFTDPPHCPPCRVQDANLQAFREWTESQGRHWKIGGAATSHVQVIPFSDATAAEFERWKVNEIPCWLWIDQTGERRRITGVLTKEQIGRFGRGEW